jgi:hypothetical protein
MLQSAKRCWIAAITLLCACAAQVPAVPATLVPLPVPAADLVLAADVPVRLTTGYTRTIPDRSRWRAVGSLPQGVVYQPVGTVFAIEGRDVHEAWLVVRAGHLQGFYLPAEARWSPLLQPLFLPPPTGAKP